MIGRDPLLGAATLANKALHQTVGAVETRGAPPAGERRRYVAHSPEVCIASWVG
jgi:hypothetical protein